VKSKDLLFAGLIDGPDASGTQGYQ